MQVRNIRRSSIEGAIDCEIDHPTLGWIPFTATADDPEPLGRDLHAAITRGEAGEIAPAPPPPEPTEADLIAAARRQVAEDYRASPPSTDAERIEALEIIIGLKDPDISLAKKTR